MSGFTNTELSGGEDSTWNSSSGCDSLSIRVYHIVGNFQMGKISATRCPKLFQK